MALTPLQSQLLHLAAAGAVIRASVDQLRHTYTSGFQGAHLDLPLFEEVRDMAGWYAWGFPDSFLLKRGHGVIAKDVLSGNFEALRKRVCEELKCDDPRCRETHAVTAELSAMTEEERLMMCDHNQKLYLGVVIGYIRCTLARGMRRKNDYEIASAHLEHPSFAALPKEVRSRIELENCEYWKDGMMNGAQAKIDAAQIGDHAYFWQLANSAIGAGVPVDPVDIDPEFLPRELYPSDEVVAGKKQNALLHLALVVGYTRLLLKRAQGIEQRDELALAQAHLEMTAFRELSDDSRRIVTSEILSISTARGTIHETLARKDVAAGDYSTCWKEANKQLFGREPSHPMVVFRQIDPSWLL